MKKLYIDFDGVILDSIKTTYKIMDEKGIDKYNPVCARAFYEILDWDKTLKISPEINNSIKNLKDLIASKQYEVNVLTHIVCYKEGVSKIKFLKKHIPEISVILVPKEFSKTEVVNPKDSILIDDYTENLKEWQNKGGIGIKFDEKKRVHQFPVITSLNELNNFNDYRESD